MKTILDILKYNFPDRNEIDPEGLQDIANEIEDIIREPAQEDEVFYLFDNMAKQLYPLCAYDYLEAYSEAFSMDIGYGVSPLTEKELKEYKKEGWTVDEDF